MLSNFGIFVSPEIKQWKQVIIIKDRKEMVCTLIDMNAPNDKNILAKVFGKLSKY